MIFRMTTLGLLIKGYLIGAANIIPGVSGGTMALALGLYRRFVAALHALDTDMALAGLRALAWWHPNGRDDLRDALKRADAGFLAILTIGALAAIFSLSSLILWLLHNQFAATYAFFFGLILASMIFPARLIRERGITQGLASLIAAALTIGLTVAGSGDQALDKAERKAALRSAPAAALSVLDSTSMPATQTAAVSWRRPDWREAGALMGGGALAMAAMILPGISGSFVLLLTGLYFDLLRAIDERELLALALFATGGLIGGLGLARLLHRLFETRRDTTMSFMLGLMVGSLWGLWPFKHTALVGDTLVILGNRTPLTWPESLLALVCALAAVVLVLGTNRLGRGKAIIDK